MSGDAPRTDDMNLKIALFGGEDGITDEMLNEVLRYATYIKERENGNNKAF